MASCSRSEMIEIELLIPWSSLSNLTKKMGSLTSRKLGLVSAGHLCNMNDSNAVGRITNRKIVSLFDIENIGQMETANMFEKYLLELSFVKTNSNFQKGHPLIDCY